MPDMIPVNNGKSSAGVITKTSLEADNSFCYPKVCIRSQAGTDAGICWCCSKNKICTKLRQDCVSSCNSA